MKKAPLQNIYVILDQQNKEQLDILCQTLSGLLSHVNLTSNLYLVTTSLSEGMPQVERIQKTTSQFLKENSFARLYIHFAHNVCVSSTKDVDYYYQYYYQSWKRSSWSFDKEGFMHQEVPRLMLLPIIVAEQETESPALGSLLRALKAAFLLPSIYLTPEMLSLAQHEDITNEAEKIYYGPATTGDVAGIVRALYSQSIVENLSADLESGTLTTDKSCTPGLVISMHDGKIYGSLDAFLDQEALIDIFQNPDVDSLMIRYHEHRKSNGQHLKCKEQAIESFANIPLPPEKAHEIGALLYHFGTLHQKGQAFIKATESFSKSLKLSPTEEASSIHFQLGLCYRNLGLYEQALEAFQKAETAYEDRYYLHFYAGLCYYEKGDLHTALEKFTKAIDMNPEREDSVRILIYMGTCYNNLGKFNDALAPLERAKAVAGSIREIYSMLGFSYFQLHDHDRAVENLQIAVKLDPSSAMDYTSLGANYREKGDLEKAISMFEKALQIDPTLTAAKENLGRLRNNL
jgi:tetratricopeptide (TPR) repeat protein